MALGKWLATRLRSAGLTVAGYGASPTSTTMIYSWNLGPCLDYLIDDWAGQDRHIFAGAAFAGLRMGGSANVRLLHYPGLALCRPDHGAQSAIPRNVDCAVARVEGYQDMTRKQWLIEMELISASAFRAASVIQELSVQLTEANERIAYLEKQLRRCLKPKTDAAAARSVLVSHVSR